MPGLLTLDAVVVCDHGGEAQTVMADPRVLVDGSPVVVESSLYLISGCSNGPPPLLPCVSGTFITSATRVTASGLPVLLACWAYVYFAVKKPDKLQSEEYQLRQ